MIKSLIFYFISLIANETFAWDPPPGYDPWGKEDEPRMFFGKEVTGTNKPRDGGWGSWSFTAEPCSASCRSHSTGLGGYRWKQRKCDNPRQEFWTGGDIDAYGAPCFGTRKLKAPCNDRIVDGCPINGGWSQWTAPTSCSVTCGPGGVRFRNRSCSNPYAQFNGKPCIGEQMQKFNCKSMPTCVFWHPWSQYDPCSKTCGKGTHERRRVCSNPRPQKGELTCVGPKTETRSCVTRECPINGGVTSWSEFGPCSASCGEGQKERTRSCTNPKPMYYGKDCSDHLIEAKICRGKPCPINGRYTEWGRFSACPAACGYGNKTRSRACTSPPPKHDGKRCKGPTLDNRLCFRKPCPVDGAFSKWSLPSPCSQTCDEGYTEQSRTCSVPFPLHGGKQCNGLFFKRNKCLLKPCARDGGFTPWSEYGACSASCGYGTRTRRRSCTSPTPAHGGKDCVGDRNEEKICFHQECPLDGGLTSWSLFSPCSKTCGEGRQWYVRFCAEPPPLHGGEECKGNLTKSEACKLFDCKSRWLEWSDWSECKPTEVCGHGVATRERECQLIKEIVTETGNDGIGNETGPETGTETGNGIGTCSGTGLAMRKCHLNCTETAETGEARMVHLHEGWDVYRIAILILLVIAAFVTFVCCKCFAGKCNQIGLNRFLWAHQDVIRGERILKREMEMNAENERLMSNKNEHKDEQR